MTMPVVRIVPGAGTNQGFSSPRGDPGLQGWLLQGWPVGWCVSWPGSSCGPPSSGSQLKTAQSSNPRAKRGRTGPAGLQEWNSSNQNPLGICEIPVPHGLKNPGHPAKAFLQGLLKREVGPEPLPASPEERRCDRGWQMPAEAALVQRPIDGFIAGHPPGDSRIAMGGSTSCRSASGQRSRNRNQAESIRDVPPPSGAL